MVILGLYSPFILQTAVSFEAEVPTSDESQARMTGIMKTQPWLGLHRDFVANWNV